MRRKKHGKNDARYWQSAAYNQELALIYEDWLMGLGAPRAFAGRVFPTPATPAIWNGRS